MTDLTASLEEEAKGSLTIRAYGRLRDMIISNQLVPGQRLKVELLRELIEVGATPIREALSLLTSDGLVERLDKRGFRVSDVSLEEYDDLHTTRCLLEEHALRLSIARGNQGWEDAPRAGDPPAPPSAAHAAESGRRPALEPGMGAHAQALPHDLAFREPLQALLQFCDQLHDRLNRYRSFAAIGASAPRDWKTEHDAIAEAAIDRDADLAVSRLIEHYSKTTGILKQTLAEMQAF